jgi:hypothetical protein
MNERERLRALLGTTRPAAARTPGTCPWCFKGLVETQTAGRRVIRHVGGDFLCPGPPREDT